LARYGRHPQSGLLAATIIRACFQRMFVRSNFRFRIDDALEVFQKKSLNHVKSMNLMNANIPSRCDASSGEAWKAEKIEVKNSGQIMDLQDFFRIRKATGKCIEEKN
jgi:hypothetical protein